jgi:hypothetical protein
MPLAKPLITNGDGNGRLHEPSLREIVSELDGFRELVLEQFKGVNLVGAERDRRYTERDQDRSKAIEAALQAAEKAVQAALVAQKEAVNKAEASQTIYNQGHNDLIRKMERMSENFASKEEFIPFRREIGELTQRIAALEGRVYGASAMAVFLATAISIAIHFLK